MIRETNQLQVYSINDVANFLQVTPRTIYKHLHEGILRGMKVGNKWRFKEEHVKAYIQKLERKVEIKHDQ